ncbi:MAG: lysophospholipid acyltransferase family protein [Phycisphaerales bacterium]|nr:lysophospholipid acyltransferase family protein [Phycisphaerales bacterium]
MLALPGLDRVYRDGMHLLEEHGTGDFETWTLEGMDATLEVTDEELAHIPEEGPLLAVANHPYGMFDGLALGALLRNRRPDYRVMGNRSLTMFPGMVPQMIQVDLTETADARRSNLSAIRACLRHLRDGGCLSMFPAGEVAHRTWSRWSVTDSPWNRVVATLARREGVHVLPIHFHGHNKLFFHLSGLLSGRLRTLQLPRTLTQLRGAVIQASIGRPVTPDEIAQCGDDDTLTEYLRSRVFMLRSRRRAHLAAKVGSLPKSDGLLPRLSTSDRCAGEVMDLPDRCLLLESGDMSVYIAKSQLIPNIVHEIGRLREVAFRAVGEGTGNDVDLDRFDRSYRHLFIWNHAKQEIVGAYRLGLTDEIVRAQGLGGLYTRTLFDFGRPLLDEIGPAIELGRSFISPEYQRAFKPLLLLWKGICRFVHAHPRYRYAFGVVSISNEYEALSKRLMTEFLTDTTMAKTLGDLVSAKNPHQPVEVTHWDHDQVRVVCTSLQSVETLVREIENDRVGVPILVKQYLKLNAQLLAVFNVDRSFSDVIDGLMLVDFTKVDRRIGDYYMGPDEIVEFLEYHGVDPDEHRDRFARPQARGA